MKELSTAIMLLRRAQERLSSVRQRTAHYPVNHDLRRLWLRNAQQDVLSHMDWLWGVQHRARP